MKVRPLKPSDLSGVMRIEECAMPSPWDEAQVLAEIGATNGVALVAENDGCVGGYAFFRTCWPECELLHLVVDPAWRRRGLAAALLGHALADFSGQKYTACFLEVRESNEAARQLYTQAGFFQTGTRKDYYHHPLEDALMMRRDLGVEE